MANAYNYSNTAVQTTLGGNISGAATSFTVAATTGFPGTTPYVLALDYGAATEELVVVTGVAGTTLTVTRGFSGTSAQSHSIGAVVRHVVNAQDLIDFRTHEGATASVHGVTGALVGATSTQTLTNKTLTSPTINGAALSGTFSGTPTFSGNTVFSGEIAHSNLFRGTRTNTTDSQWEARATGDANARVFIRADGQIFWGPGTAGVDTNLYRAGSSTLQTDDQFVSSRPLLTDATWISQRSSDTGSRWYMTAGGVATWGDGAGAMDVNLYRSAADTLKTDDSLVINGNLTVNGVGQVLRSRKAADTTVTSNTTISDDPHLTLPVAANTTYQLDGILFVSSTSTTPDFKMALNGPAGVAGWWAVIGPSTTATSDPDAVRVAATAIGVTPRSYGIPLTGTVFGLQLQGMVETSGTAGNVTVQWAQATSDPAGTILKIYSWMTLTRVA